MTQKSPEEGDVARTAVTRQASQGRLQWVLWLWIMVLTVGLAVDLSLRYIPRSVQGDQSQPEKPVSKDAGTHFFDLFPLIGDDTADGGPIPLMGKGGNVGPEEYQSIKEDGLYFLCGEVTLKSESTHNLTITINKRSEAKDKWEPILVGHIAQGSLSTGFLGRILLLEADSQISMQSYNNHKLRTADVNLSFIVIYKLRGSPGS